MNKYLCINVFRLGNACELLSTSFYDRVYCRPGVPPEHIEFMKSLIKIGGVLVMPLDNSLVRITRIDELRFDTIELFKVAHTDLIVPEGSGLNKIEFPPIEPVSLKDLCRTAIRSFFYENILKEFPDMDIFTKCKIVSDPEKKIFGLRDTLSESIRSQFNLNEEQIFYLRFPLDTFDDTDDLESISETCSMFGESEDDDVHYDVQNSTNDNAGAENDISNHDDNNLADGEKLNGEEKHRNTNVDNKLDVGEKDKITDDTKIDHDIKLDNQETRDDNKSDGEKYKQIDIDEEVGCNEDVEKENDESTIYVSYGFSKRKSPEAGCSQCVLEMENQKKTKTDSSTEESTSVSTSSGATSPNRSPSVTDYEVDVDNEHFDVDEEINARQLFNSFRTIMTNTGDNTENDEIDYNDLIRYKFQSDCKKNKLSLLLKDKINSLPLPVPLKIYLNYFRSD
ncbi:Hypothetical protein CINCED_3A001612 [Cinara cedri]|uniref:Uncharacterized protein n=1 Tax=Cinara cedri TaxID=506608 RepID=A0A5E4NJU2_9HEMI|nr:Hypothetical protein CINCED_3A001612 [Cinara cedri]